MPVRGGTAFDSTTNGGCIRALEVGIGSGPGAIHLQRPPQAGSNDRTNINRISRSTSLQSTCANTVRSVKLGIAGLATTLLVSGGLGLAGFTTT